MLYTLLAHLCQVGTSQQKDEAEGELSLPQPSEAGWVLALKG